jgi:DNA-binding winged helix-turn-helix (wHTH) protein
VKLTEQHTIFLPQKRGDLVAALLRRSGGVVPGDWVDDDVLVSRVWGSEGASRTQINVLIHRARQSLTEAGLNGPSLLERAPGGGATRFRLAAGAQVEML